MGRWTGTEYVSDGDGAETRFSHQDPATGNYMSVTRVEGISDDVIHDTRTYDSSGNVINTHTTMTNPETGQNQRYGDREVAQDTNIVVSIWNSIFGD